MNQFGLVVRWMWVLNLLVHVSTQTDEQDADDETLGDHTSLNDIDACLDTSAFLAIVKDGITDDAQETRNAYLE